LRILDAIVRPHRCTKLHPDVEVLPPLKDLYGVAHSHRRHCYHQHYTKHTNGKRKDSNSPSASGTSIMPKQGSSLHPGSVVTSRLTNVFSAPTTNDCVLTNFPVLPQRPIWFGRVLYYLRITIVSWPSR